MSKDRPIEKLLKDYAKERQTKAEPQLTGPHPATRELLQAEVRRTYAPPQKKVSWVRSLFIAWPRLAPALGLFLILGLVVWTLNRAPEEEFKVARAPSPTPAASTQSEAAGKNTPESRLAQPRPQAPPSMPAITTEEVEKLGRSRADSDSFLTSPDNHPPAPVTTSPALSTETAKQLAKTPDGADRQLLRTAPKVESNPAETPAALSAKSKIANPSAPLPSGARLEPTQADPAPKVPSAKPSPQWGTLVSFTNTPENAQLSDLSSTAILTSFHLAQRERQIQITEADGSVYSGLLAPMAAPAQIADPARRARFSAALVTISNAAPPLTLRATGLNLSLNMQLVIDAILTTNLPIIQIEGTARVGPSNTVRIKAQRAE